jgi:hypothetical protein
LNFSLSCIDFYKSNTGIFYINFNACVAFFHANGYGCDCDCRSTVADTDTAAVTDTATAAVTAAADGAVAAENAVRVANVHRRAVPVQTTCDRSF